VKWLLVLVIVICNTVGDLFMAYGMRQHGNVRQFHPSALGRLATALARNKQVIGGVVAMAVGFFA
jgi:drug/metabolite transporter (DMT)-like permease